MSILRRPNLAATVRALHTHVLRRPNLAVTLQTLHTHARVRIALTAQELSGSERRRMVCQRLTL